jgi:RHS repeat-associated protein
MEPVSLAGTSSYVSGATYNALGLLNGMNHGNTTATRLYYYGSNLEHTTAGNSSYGRLRRICVSVNANGCADDANAAGALFKMAYAYDAVGNITNMGDRTLGQGLAYSYDAQDRLASWSIGGTTQETYSYDVLGRMTNRSTLGTFSYGHASKVHAVTGVGAGTFSYDANGNMLSRWQSGTTFTHEWNADNKASRVHGGGQDIRYFYDADGVLVRRTSGGVTTVFVGPHAEWNSSTGWTNYYHFNGQRVAMRNSSGVFWLHGDHLGSASLATNSAGGTHSQVRYGPFGNERWTGGNSTPTSYKFTDQRAEDAVGLYDYDARLYSPLLARFISPDSLVPALDNVQDWNHYAYVRHNPLIYTDPTGHVPILIPLAAMFVVKVALKAAPVIVAGSAIAHRAAPAVQRIVNSPMTQQAIAKTGQAVSSAQHFAHRNPQLVESVVEGTVAAGMSYAQSGYTDRAVADGLITFATGRVDSKIKQLGAENNAHKFVVGAQRVVAQGIGTGIGELSKQLLLFEPGNITARTSGQTIAQSLTMAIPGEGAVPTALRTALGSYGGSQVTDAIQRSSCQPSKPC